MNLVDQLKAKPIEELESMTDEQLLEYFKPVLSLTRPENVIVNVQNVSLKVEKPTKKAKPTYDVTATLAGLPKELQDKLAAMRKQQ